MNKNFENVILNNWSAPSVRADVEEDDKDVLFAIKYNDHGDDFILIRTNDGKTFEYGWFLNRGGWPEYKDLDKPWYEDEFDRKPQLFREFDANSHTANEIYFEFERRFQHDRMDIGFNPRIEQSTFGAQWEFDRFYKFMQEKYNKNIAYNFEHKGDVKQFLEANGIATEENLVKLDLIHFSTKVDGADGIAAKKQWRTKDYTDIFCDDVDTAIYKGKQVDPSTLKYDTEEVDYFDFSRKIIDLGQFE